MTINTSIQWKCYQRFAAECIWLSDT